MAVNYSDAVPFSYDLATVKHTDRFFHAHIYQRLILIAATDVVLWLAFDLWQMAIWFCIYFGYLLFHAMLVAVMPARVGVRGFVLLTVSCFICGASFLAGAAYLWMQPETAVRMVGIIAIGAAMMATVTARRQNSILLVVDAAVIGSGIVAFSFMSYWMLDQPKEALVLFVTFSAIFLYFLREMFDVWDTRNKLAQAQEAEVAGARIEALGRLTGGVAHDFNNLLTVISGNLDLMSEVTDADEKAELARQAHAATRKAAAVTAQLLAYSRQDVLTPKRVSPIASINVVRELMARLLPSNFQLDVKFSDGIEAYFLELDATRFETVLMNLCINARDAMSAGGVITLGLASSIHKDHIACGNGVLPANMYLHVSVCDTGVGIAVEEMGRVCEPYYSTKAIGMGSGLGLSMAKGFVEQSGGTLHIVSKLDVGTTVTLVFPVLDVQ